MPFSSTLLLESLETRLNLSVATNLPVTSIPDLQIAVKDRFTMVNPVQQTSVTFASAAKSGGSSAAALGLITPGKLTATPGSTSITITWTDNATKETGYKVFRSTDGSNYTQVAVVGRNGIKYVDSAVTKGVTYFYRVAAYNTTSMSALSSTVSATISAISKPSTPDSIAASTVDTSSIKLTWLDSAANETGYRVYRSTDGVNYALTTSLAANSTTWTDSGLNSGTLYYYKVAAWNSGGETLAGPVSATTATPIPAPVLAPSAPGNTVASTVDTSSIKLTWLDSAANETGYRVYRSTDGVTYTLATSLAANSTSWTDSGLNSGTLYYYEVAAWNSGGETLAGPVSATTATPAPAPTPSITPVAPVNIYTRNMTSFTELRIDGTSGSDSIYVTQSGGVLTIVANGQTYTYANTFGDLMIQGMAGDDTINVDSSVNIATLIYGGDGNNVITNKTTAKATIVTIGNGVNTVTGNGINTGFWVNQGDTVNATSAEIALGGVNRVGNFYQPWTTNTASVDYISRNLNGQNLRDPTDSGNTIRLNNSSFFGTGAVIKDVNQGTLGDCYFLAPLASLANNEPGKLMNMGVDLGDGTYAVRFIRNGVTTFVRVDGDFTAGWFDYGLMNDTPGPSGNLWSCVFEKAYAFFRSGANTYASTDYGSQTAAFSDMGITSTSISATSSATTLLNTINNSLAAGKAIVSNTIASISSGAPLIGSHVYSVIGAYLDSTGQLMLQLRNPWGIDGAGSDSNPNDGLVTISYSLYSKNFGVLTTATA